MMNVSFLNVILNKRYMVMAHAGKSSVTPNAVTKNACFGMLLVRTSTVNGNGPTKLALKRLIHTGN